MFCTNSQQRAIPKCDKEELIKFFRKTFKMVFEFPLCENFEDLGETQSCPASEKCFLGKCKYFTLFWVHISCWYEIYILQVTKGDKDFVIRDCMALSFLKKLDPDAPEAGCVDLKFTGGGEVSKKEIRIYF